MYSLLVSLTLNNLLYFALHLTSSGSFPRPLSAKEERECLVKIKAGDMEARNHLVEHNLRLVAHIIKKYYTNTDDPDDLISIGTIGLIKAVSTFDMDKGTRFATYASRCIENEILMYFRSKRKSNQDVSFSDPIVSSVVCLAVLTRSTQELPSAQAEVYVNIPGGYLHPLD